MKSNSQEYQKKNYKTVIKTIFKTTIAIVVIAITILSCAKSDDAPAPIVVVTPEQNPLKGFLAISGFDQKKTILPQGPALTQGFSFIPLSNGKMTEIVAKIPNAGSGFSVSLWDKNTGKILSSWTVYSVDSAKVTTEITPIDLVAGKEYLLSFEYDRSYKYEKTDGSNVAYPFIIGDIKITGFYEKAFAIPVQIPDISVLNYFSGDVSFKFQK
jgi:hypothetical protein